MPTVVKEEGQPLNPPVQPPPSSALMPDWGGPKNAMERCAGGACPRNATSHRSGRGVQADLLMWLQCTTSTAQTYSTFDTAMGYPVPFAALVPTLSLNSVHIGRGSHAAKAATDLPGWGVLGLGM